MNEIKEEVRSYLVENVLFGEDNGMTDAASLLELGIIDSTGVLEWVAFLESTYGFKVADERDGPGQP